MITMLAQLNEEAERYKSHGLTTIVATKTDWRTVMTSVVVIFGSTMCAMAIMVTVKILWG